jgi:hypothetical protein
MTEASPAAAAVAAAGGAALLALVLLRRRRAIDEYAETFAAVRCASERRARARAQQGPCQLPVLIALRAPTQAARARNVEIARPREFLAKCARLREAGTARLQIVTDFDRTITMCFNVCCARARARRRTAACSGRRAR